MPKPGTYMAQVMQDIDQDGATTLQFTNKINK